jgi:hypothetical protein
MANVQKRDRLGKNAEEDNLTATMFYTSTRCSVCQGTGMVGASPCLNCGQTGQVFQVDIKRELFNPGDPLIAQIDPERVFVPGLDPGIEKAVIILRRGGVETYESCQGGEGHSYPEPTVRFFGERSEGFRAFAWAMQHGLNVSSLRRIWQVIDGELTGPNWEMTFVKAVEENPDEESS